MATMTEPAKQTSPVMGPFVTAAASTGVCLGLLISLWLGMPVSMLSMFALVIPGMFIATGLIAVAMGWMFVAFGRYNRYTRWPWGTAAFIAVTMLELFWLTYIASESTIS